MPEQSVITALDTLLSGAAFTGGNPPLLRAHYADMPDFPYTGGFPFTVVAPATQVSDYATSGDYMDHGYYTVGYFDDIAATSNRTQAQVLSQARLFVTVLKAAIRADYTLGGAVFTAGEGPGIQVRWTLAGEVDLYKGRAVFLLPINIWIVDQLGS